MSQIKIEQLAPHEVRDQLHENAEIKLLDVRGPDEHRLASIEGAILISETLIEEILQSWPKETQMILHCHHGFRSQQACEFLQAQGFQNLANMTGGIDAWSQEIDPTIKRY